MQEKISELIQEIQQAYDLGHIGHSLYKELIGKARELQVM